MKELKRVGGAGRSTVSTNLAEELSKQAKTMLIDCDMPQGTSASLMFLPSRKKSLVLQSKEICLEGKT